jgi:hypothetical protein
MAPVLLNPSMLAAAGGGSGYLSHALAKSPLGVWMQGEASGTTLVDSSGNSHNGTYTGSPSLNQTGILPTDTGKSVAYSGSGQYATVANASWMIPTDFTAEIWFKSTSTGGTQDVFTNAHASLTSRWMMRVASGQLQYYSWSGSSWTEIHGSISSATLYHAVITYNGTTQIKKLYLNKTLVATSGAVVIAGVATVTAGLGIAALQSGSELWAGNAQAAALYGHEFTQSEVDDNYDAA